MRKIYLLTILFVAFAFVGCRDFGVKGSGHLTEEIREISEFSRIEISGAFNLEVMVGQEPSIEISAEDNLIDLIETEVRGSKLVIDTRKSISPRKRIKIKVYTPKLTSVESSGASNVYAEGLSGMEFSLELSGAGNIELVGKVDEFSAELSGAGSLDARKLEARYVTVDLSGASSADVYVTERLDAEVSGVGNINYWGDPEEVHSDVSGVGSIKRKD